MPLNIGSAHVCCRHFPQSRPYETQTVEGTTTICSKEWANNPSRQNRIFGVAWAIIALKAVRPCRGLDLPARTSKVVAGRTSLRALEEKENFFSSKETEAGYMLPEF